MRIQNFNQNNYQNKNICFKQNSCFLLEGLNHSCEKLSESTREHIFDIITHELRRFKQIKENENPFIIQDPNNNSLFWTFDEASCAKADQVTSPSEKNKLMEELQNGIRVFKIIWNKIRPKENLN